ncbi:MULTISPECIES: DedA family protein [Providencia]|uniref:DedA family inner membrane protein n=1 Tax=Providencia heimbachae ATCC 35613 TaxID=1354272 RepID=A0A1B7JQN5_9GAMM|nr:MULTISPECIES: DedA family protein [Providencia]MBP6123711.1 DedA family protein [Providencia sp.]OAT50238.1 DedA family inner membrane protein [Providencia heimbachae ATCC 35613]QCJ68981.1 DedA family protein [Providencia heimbachae]SQH12020.1 Inner membrane protein YghB [Providencia heimbachae]
MEVLREIVQALWQHDFLKLSNPEVLWVIYTVLFIIIVLENGVLPAAFLPGDTLLILSGALIAKGVLHFIPTILLLATAASLGCWLGFLQGRWLSETNMVKRWLSQIPDEYHTKANNMFNKQGLYALLIGRFLAFVRTLLPVLAGLSDLSHRRFQLFNWLSGLLWVSIIVTLGYALNQIPFVKEHEQIVISALMIIPVILLVAGLIGSIVMYWKHRKGFNKKES